MTAARKQVSSVDDEAPSGEDLTLYDEEHFVTYLRLLDAEADGANWAEVAKIVLHRDPSADPVRTHRCWQSHLERAQWMTRKGWVKILQQEIDDCGQDNSS
jgi:hypothetical protein